MRSWGRELLRGAAFPSVILVVCIVFWVLVVRSLMKQVAAAMTTATARVLPPPSVDDRERHGRAPNSEFDKDPDDRDPDNKDSDNHSDHSHTGVDKDPYHDDASVHQQ